MTGSEEILSRLPDAVLVIDRHKRLTGWHGAAERLFGWSEDEVLGSVVEDLLRPRDVNGNRSCIGPCDLTRVLRITKGVPEQEVLVRTRGGADVWVGVACGLDRNASGRIARLIAVARDVTRKKRIDLAKSEVISAVAHELRSPLTSVKGFTSTLLHRWDRFDDDTKKHLLLTINTDADRVTRLIGELLDVSRLEAGRLHLRRQIVQMSEVAARVVERIQPQAAQHRLVSRFPEGFPQVDADPDKVEQVLTNLVENAVKYTERGIVTVAGVAEHRQVRVSVSDEGEGIPREHRLQVFGKFFRHEKRSGNPSGTGLGLYICKGLVEAHGGRIWVDEAPGGGAVFSFTLPTAGTFGSAPEPDAGPLGERPS